MQRDKAFLHDVIASMRMVVDYVGGKSFADFARDQACVDAVVRRMEIIGEAAKRLSSPFRDQRPEVPWQKMAGIRDRLIHGYDDVDLDAVFNAVKNVIPTPVPHLEIILSALPAPA